MVDRAPPPRIRRADILAAAEREFAAFGWSGGRIERIALDARVNKQLLFHYFESKSGLFAAAQRSLLTRFEPDADPVTSLVDEVRRVMRAVEAAARAIPGIVFLVPRRPVGDDFPAEADATLRDWRERQRARLEDAITEGQRRGHFRDDLDPRVAADVGLAMALGAGAIGRTTDAAGWIVDYCAWR